MFSGKRRAYWIVAGAAGAVFAGLGTWLVRRGMLGDLQDRALASASARATRARVRGAPELEGCDIHVVPLADGIVELRGVVPTAACSHQAMELAQQPDAVHTVLNKLVVSSEETRLAANRRRFAAGAPALHETHWYGNRRGMGRRRTRNDGKQSVVDREVEASEPDEAP